MRVNEVPATKQGNLRREPTPANRPLTYTHTHTLTHLYKSTHTHKYKIIEAKKILISWKEWMKELFQNEGG